MLQEKLSEMGLETSCPVAILIKDGKFLTGLRNYTLDKYKDISVWTVPGGRCDAGESLETTLRREVTEEVGITDLKIGKYLGEVPGAKEGDRVFVFTAHTNEAATLMEPEKFSEWRWFSPDELPGEFINQKLLEVITEELRK